MNTDARIGRRAGEKNGLRRKKGRTLSLLQLSGAGAGISQNATSAVARTPRLSSEASATKLEEESRPILRLLSLSNGGTPQRLIPLREGRSHKTKSVADTPIPKVYLQYCAVVLAGVARSSSTNGAKANPRK